MKLQEIHEVEQGIRPPESVKMTLEEFLEHDIEGYEYVKGELVPIAPPSREHGEISVNVIRYLDAHVYQNKLGRLYTAETTFQVAERIMKPDVAFVSTTQLTGNKTDKTKGFPIPPDLAVEVVSPSDVQSRIAEKALAYLNAGTRLVWVLEPVSQTVTVYRSETNIETLTRDDTLTGENVIPGFTCPVAHLFE
jgi:Uma2 family endonuclease